MGRLQSSQLDGTVQPSAPPATFANTVPEYLQFQENIQAGFPQYQVQTNIQPGISQYQVQQNNQQGIPQYPVQPNIQPGIPQYPVQANIQPGTGIPPDFSSGVVIENLVIGHPWKTGLFDCHEDPTDAVITTFAPCVTFGQISEVLDEGEMTCPLGSFIYLIMMPALCTQWIMASKYRDKLRKKYNLVEAPYLDAVSHMFCPCCSLCQEFRELKNRGLDPALGWNGIRAQGLGSQHQHGEANVPPPNQAMTK